MDLLSDVLRDLRLQSAVFSMAEFRAPWGFDKSAVTGAPFYVVVEGRCFFRIGGGDPVELMAGDLVVVPHGAPYAAMSDPDAQRVPFARILDANGIEPVWSPDQRIEGLHRIEFGGSGPVTRLIIGMFAFRNQSRNPVLAALPGVIHVPGRRQRGVAWLEGALRLLIDEAAAADPGYQTVVERLADIIFVQAVRESIVTAPARGVSWLRGLADPRIARALSLIHSRPQERWTVASLADAVALSRTGFANRFRALIGSTVMEYVTAHRMHVARDLLANSTLPLAEISARVGYQSEISFSRAFSRRTGTPPGQYRRSGNSFRRETLRPSGRNGPLGRTVRPG